MGATRSLARALTEIENRGPNARALLSALFPYSGKALRVGVTGSPGVGKSTLINQLIAQLRKQGRTVAIVSVDPTSPYSGGAILGDRVRMQSHHADSGVFVRSMATRGFLGGIAPTTADVVMVLEAAGYDVVLIETVGVGQAEIDIMKWVSKVILVLTPAMGDDIQTMKAGVMEIADVFLINKADQRGVSRVKNQLEALLTLLPKGSLRPPIVSTVATKNEGVDTLLETLDTVPHSSHRLATGWEERLVEMVKQEANEHLFRDFEDFRFAEMACDIVEGRKNPYDLVDTIINEARGKRE